MGCQESQTHKQEEQIRIRPKEKEAKKKYVKDSG